MSEPVDPAPEARERLSVAFVTGVSPDKWSRVWAERMTIPLELIPRAIRFDANTASATATASAARAEPHLPDGIDMALARFDAEVPDGVHAIPLWNETPVVVAPKDHAISVVDSVSLAELADENILEGQDDDTLDLVAAGVGLARMPQSVFRATGRRDVIARPVSDAEPTRIALAWTGATDEAMDEFIGIVRGRSVKSSRGAGTDDAPPPKRTAAAKAAAAEARAKAARAAESGKKTPPRPARGFPRAKPGKSGKPGKRR